MKNKKILSVLTAGMTMAALSVTAHAMTIGIEQPDGSIKYYRCTDTGEEVGAAQEIEHKPNQVDYYITTDKSMDIACAYSSEVAETPDEKVEVTIKQSEDMIEAVAEESTYAYAQWSKEEREAYEKEEDSLREIGIEQNGRGCWTWKGKEIHILLDENGGIYQNGSEEAVREKLYVFVSRDQGGNPLEAEVLDGNELLEKMALEDIKNEVK